MKTNDLIAQLPGEPLIQQGLADLKSGRRTAPAYLVMIAHRRLQQASLLHDTDVSLPTEPELELQLYRLLRQSGGDAYS